MGREETQHPTLIRLVTGHYHVGVAYQNWRAHGTGDWLLIYTAGGAVSGQTGGLSRRGPAR